MAWERRWSVALRVSGISSTFQGDGDASGQGPGCKLNGQTEKCIIDEGDAKMSRSKHRIRFKYRVINPPSTTLSLLFFSTLSCHIYIYIYIYFTLFGAEKNGSHACRQY